MRAIILAAGRDERWDHRRYPNKHFIEIDGEPLVPRIVRQLRDRAEVIVSGHPERAYKLPDAALYVPYLNPANHHADKYLCTVPLWSHDGRTVLLFGDCWYSDEAIDTIIDYPEREWRYFCRFEPSELTGKIWGEGWGWGFYPEHIPEVIAAHHRTIELVDRGVLWRNDGWEHYRAMCGLPDERMGIEFHGDYGRATVIDDWTEDFDFPQDLDTYLERRSVKVA